MTLEFLDNYLNKKLRENEEIIKLSFFEVRVKLNLEEEDAIIFLRLVAQKLVNNGYSVYTTKQKYQYHNQSYTVQENELLVGIKNDLF